MTTDTPVTGQQFKAELIALIPHLRAFARSLCDNPSMADDIAQDTMLKAWKARDSFKPNTNMKAWAFTILRNHYYSEKRRDWRVKSLDPVIAETTLVTEDTTSKQIELLAMHNALQQLPDEQREAVVLVGAGGLSYEEAALVCGCAVGTIKSRVSRGRKALEQLMEDPENPFTRNSEISASDAFGEIVTEAERLTRQGS